MKKLVAVIITFVLIFSLVFLLMLLIACEKESGANDTQSDTQETTEDDIWDDIPDYYTDIETGFILYKVNNSGKGYYTFCGHFESYSEAQDYFAETYSIESEILEQHISSKSKYADRFGFGTPDISFSFGKGICINVKTNQDSIYYVLMDISTYNGDKEELPNALYSLVDVKWGFDFSESPWLELRTKN